MLLAAALVAGWLLFRELLTLLVLLLMVVILAIPLSAVATRLERVGIPRQLGALLGLIGGLAVVGAIIALIVPSFTHELNRLVDALPGIVDRVRGEIRDLTGAEPGEVGRRFQDFVRGYTEHPLRLAGPVSSVGLGVAGAVGGLVLILITAVFVAARPEPLIKGCLRLFPPPRRPRALGVMRRLRDAYVGWMRGLAVASLLIGVFVYVGLRIVGLEFALFFAVLSALLEVIPYFGALISGAPAVVLAFTHSPGKALAVLAVYVIAHQLDGNVIAPVVMARAAKLHPAVVAVGVVVVERLFGFLGLIVAVPIISTVLILVEELWIRPAERRSAPVPVAVRGQPARPRETR